MLTSQPKLLLCLLLVLFACTCGRAQQSCSDDDCGDIQVGFVGVNSEVVFCEGTTVVLDNNSEPGYNQFEIGWGDETIDTVFTYDNVSHVYNIATADEGVCKEKVIFDIGYRGYTECDAGESCQSASVTFSVEPKPQAIMEVSNEVCAGRPVDFSSRSCNATGFSWDFGDGNTSILENPMHTYSQAGSYTVTLMVSGVEACTAFMDETSQVVNIVTPPNALFDIDDDDLVACTNIPITLTNESNDDTNIEWTISPATGWAFTDTLMTLTSGIISIIFTTDQEYTITLTGRNACDEVEAMETIIIQEAPEVGQLNDLTDCDEVTVSPSILGYSVTGTTTQICWEFPDGNAVNVCSESFDPINFTESGLVILRVTSPCGDVITREAMVNVQSSDPPTLTAEPEYCTGSDPDTLSASSPGGNWGGPGIVDAVLGVFDPFVAGPGDHILTYRITSGACQNMNSITVTVIESATVMSENRSLCIDNDPITLTATPVGGSWSGPGIVDPTGIFRPDSAGVGDARPIYTVDDDGGCRVMGGPVITVAALPVVTTQDTALVCYIDENVSAAAISEAEADGTVGGFSWTLNGEVLPDGTFNPTTDLSAPGNYILSYDYNRTPCIVSGQLILRVVEQPQLVLTPQPILCLNGDPVMLEANLPDGTWSGTAVTDGVGSRGTFDPTAAGVGEYTLRYDITEGTCRNAGSLDVEVVPGASLDVPSNEFCFDGGTAVLEASPAGGYWTGDGIVDSTGTFDPEMAGVGSSFPTYTFPDADGCIVTTSSEVEVFVVPEITGRDTALACLVDEAVNLLDITGVSSTVDGGGYTWTVNGNPVVGQTFNPLTDLPGPGVYPAGYLYENGPCRVPGDLLLEVIDNPELVLVPQNNVCISAQTLALGVNLSGGTWDGNGVNQQTGVIDLTVAGGGTFAYTYRFQPGGSCAQDAEQLITIEDPGSMIMAGDDQANCEDRDFYITLTGGSPAGGSWSGPGVTDSVAGTVDLTQLAPDSNYIYTYLLVSATTPGCNAEAFKTLSYNPKPDISYIISGSPCINELFQLNAAQDPDDFTFSWAFGDGTESMLPNPTHTYTAGGEFMQTLLVINNTTGCPADTSAVVYVTTPPSPAFTLDSVLGCAPFLLNLNDESTGDDFTSYWLVEQDTLPGGGTQTVTLDGYLEDTEVEITLVAENFCGARPLVQRVVVKPYPAVDFGLATDDGCSLFTPSISNVTLGNPDSFEWDMGEGTLGQDSLPPLVEYFTPEDSVSIYYITLIAINECGYDTLVKPVTVHPPDVRAFIGLDTVSGCQPWTFEPRSFSTPGAALAWDILAPDGSTVASGNEAAPSFSLDQSGIHRVILRAARCGSAADTVFVEVLPAPEVGFMVDPGVCTGDELNLMNTSTGIAGGFYTLGNGDTLRQVNGAVTYPAEGDFTVTFTGFSALNNCPAEATRNLRVHPLPEVAIAATDTANCSPLRTTLSNPITAGTLTYAWEFDDGTDVSDQATPEHTYNVAGEYFPRLTVTDSVGCVRDISFSRITVHPDPVPAFSITTDRFCAGHDSLRLRDESSGAVAIQWGIDGGIYPGPPPILALSGVGERTVNLTATSIHGCAADTSREYTVLVSPEAVLVTLPDTVCLGTGIGFTSNSTASTDLVWDLGDGTGNTTNAFSYTYGSAGGYSVTLVAINTNGCPADTATNSVLINPLPMADFTLSESVRCGTPAPVAFTNASSGAIIYSWEFGDGNQATGLNANNVYTAPGMYSPQLIAETAFGCRDTAVQQLVVSGAPVAEFIRPPALGCSPFLLQLAAEPTEALRYEWYLDDAFAPSLGLSFDTILTENRLHRLRLIAIYDDLCRDTLDVTNLITLEPRPVAGFTFVEDQLPNRLGDVLFQSTSTGGDELWWNLGDGTIRTDAAFTHEYRINRDIEVTHAVTQRYSQGLVCSDTLQESIESEWLTTFFAPNAISPQSGTEEVRTWGAKGFGVAEYSLKVFSAYGQIIFSTSELENSRPSGRWDGRLITTGGFALQGAYTWRAVVEYVDGTKESRVGTVTVLR
jgi:PKD repeat protein